MDDMSKSRALKLAKDFIGGQWLRLQTEDIHVAPLSGGLSSRLFVCEDLSGESGADCDYKKFLIRLFGGKLVAKDEPLRTLTTVEENILFAANSDANLGPKLLGVFDGGRLEQFMESRLAEKSDFRDDNLLIQFASKTARYHCLSAPISRAIRPTLEIMRDSYYGKSDLVKLRELIAFLGVQNFQSVIEFDWRAEIQWLLDVSSKIKQKIVLLHGDINQANFLVLDSPDKFNERVMLIDYEFSAYEARGRDLGNICMSQIMDLKDNSLTYVQPYPDDQWRRKLATYYLEEYRRISPSDWDESIDNVDHLLMEIDLGTFATLHFYIGYFVKQDKQSFGLRIDKQFAKSWAEAQIFNVELYKERKTIFLERYGKHLGIS